MRATNLPDVEKIGMSLEERTVVIDRADTLFSSTTRRNFLRTMGVGGSIVMLPSLFAACNNDDPGITGTNNNTTYTLNLSDDIGILNYAYALEQLEAAYYTAAITSPGFSQLSADEKEVLTDLQKHEVIHREFFKKVLADKAIPAINFNTTTVGTLTASRAVLLSTSQLLEDTGVSAYNGAGKYLKSSAYLLLAGKIVSVEARHASAIRDIRDGANGRLFAGDDVVNTTTGLDVKAEPGTVGGAVNSLKVILGTIAIGTPPDATKNTPDAPAPTPV
ncbi:MAG: ferritin-like domain-containing protein [Gemmatimonadota bacterium]|nr:ferritin-like domain-containing protein [Gemmatimonadota bacterium]